MNSDELYRDADKALSEQTIVGEAEGDDYYSEKLATATDPMEAAKWAMKWAHWRVIGNGFDARYQMWIAERLANWIEEYAYDIANDD